MTKFSDSISTLADLALGTSGVVTALTCTGAQRDRMMDLGILPGTRIAAEMRGPMGDPTAYRVRGALIALRREQAATIHITQGDDSVLAQSVPSSLFAESDEINAADKVEQAQNADSRQLRPANEGTPKEAPLS